MKVVIAALATDEMLNALAEEHPEVDFVTADTEDERKREIKDADVYMGFPSREVFLAADHLRWIQHTGTGIDGIMSFPELVDSDVVLTNCRGPHAGPMADHAIGMMVNLAHHTREILEDQKAHRWNAGAYQSRMVELSGKTMGILALGDIGMAVARRAHGFGMRVYGVDKQPVPAPEVTEAWGPERLDELMEISDWFVVTAPLTSETEGLIDRRRIELLKDGAYVIVVSRGKIIDEEALLDGLRSGRIAGAGLDVTAVEPLPPDSPLWDQENLIISPHVSALTPEMWDGRREIFKENLRRFLGNKPFLYVCDKRAGY